MPKADQIKGDAGKSRDARIKALQKQIKDGNFKEKIAARNKLRKLMMGD